MTFVGINNSYGAIAVQSPTPQVFIISKFTGYTNGMAKNSIIDNSNFSNLQIAPNCYGHGQSIAISYATITSGNQVGCITLASDLTFANIGGVGTFSVANDAVHRQQVQQTFGVPGGKYYYGVYSQGFPICNTGTTFTVTDTTQTGSFVGGLITGGSTFYATDIGTTQPTPTCPSGPLIGQSANAFGTYPADTITQRYSTGTDMTQFAPP
jgi:hypothetical protein